MIIAICGRKGTGKGTVSDYIEEKYGYKQYALAQPLKDAAQAMFGFTDRQVNGAGKDERDTLFNVTPRLVLQTLGTEWGQSLLGRTVWVKVFMMKHWTIDNWVINDVRFQHELDGLAELDSVVSIQLYRDGEIDPHPSEAGNLKTDYHIDNNGSFGDLREKIDEVMDAHTPERI
jgi:hypothetical protein